MQRYREILSQAEREKIGPPPSPLGSKHIEASHLQIHVERILLREYLPNSRNTSITSPSWLNLHARRKAVPCYHDSPKNEQKALLIFPAFFWKWPAFSSTWVWSFAGLPVTSSARQCGLKPALSCTSELMTNSIPKQWAEFFGCIVYMALHSGPHFHMLDCFAGYNKFKLR